MRHIKKLIALIFAFSLCACSVLSNNMSQEDEQEILDILTEHLWVNDTQNITFYELDKDGKIYSFNWTGTGKQPIYDVNNRVLDSVVLLDNQVSEKKEEGSYAIHKDCITLYLSNMNIDMTFDQNELTAPYIEHFDGSYFLFEQGYKPSGDMDDMPFYLYGVTKKEMTELPYDSYYGYYEYHDNKVKEEIRIDIITDTTISGKFLYADDYGNYNVRDFSWEILDKDPLTGQEVFQNGADIIYYKFNDNGNIFVNYPASYRTPRTYVFIGGIENLVHPEWTLFGDLSTAPFYGIWTMESKNITDCENEAAALQALGFNAQVYLTTDWSNLNPEPYYTVSAGIYGSEENANVYLAEVQATGRVDAYVKYTGGHY